MIKKNEPLVSVVIPCYNHEDYVQSCIQSVIDQTYENIELIIIDDGSKDNSVLMIREMINSCEDRFNNFKFISRPNKGLSATLNEAITLCNGVYFSVIASDDVLFNYKLSEQVSYLELNLEYAGVFGAFQIIDNNGVVTGVRKRKNAEYDFNDIFLHKHELPAPTQLIRTSLIKEVGGYSEKILIEDWFMWLKISSLNQKFAYMDRVFVSYRRHENNTSKVVDKMMQSRLMIIDLFKEHYLYDDALAYAYLTAANDYLSVDRSKALDLYKKFKKYKNEKGFLSSFKFLLKFMFSFIQMKKIRESKICK